MSADDPPSGNSMAAQHAEVPQIKLRVAPTDGSSSFNTVRIPLIPVACWKLEDPAFAFDSSFVSPNFRGELTTLSGIIAANEECPAALFGHCDPAGDDALNKTLGDRRAMAIYALLTRQPDIWESIYSNQAVGDVWGTHAIQSMLAQITGRSTDDHGKPVDDPSSNPYYSGAVNGSYGASTVAAVKAFQTDSGHPASGQADKGTRKALFGSYMDWLCTAGDPAATPPPAPFRMQPADFLGGTGAQPGDLPKMSLQSCGKLNPIVLLSSAEMNGGNQTARNAHDAPNRRVIMFLFPKGTTVADGDWPCPKVKESFAACKKAFWPDGDHRRTNGAKQREYSKTRDTMACRFYDRFARRSPCEGQKPPPTFLYVTVYPPPTYTARTDLLALSVQDQAGKESLSIPAAQAKAEEGGALTWTLDPRGLPQPTQLFLVGSGDKQPVGAPFDPVKLCDALSNTKLADADALYDPRPPPPDSKGET